MQNLKIAAAHIRTRRNGHDIENLKFKATSIKKMKATFGDGKLVYQSFIQNKA